MRLRWYKAIVKASLGQPKNRKTHGRFMHDRQPALAVDQDIQKIPGYLHACFLAEPSVRSIWLNLSPPQL